MGSPDEDEIRAINWVARASRPVGSLADPAVVCQCDISDALMVNLNGTPAAPEYFSRRRVTLRRPAARVSGLASGLAPAVRPAGSAEAPALKGLRLR